MDDQIHLSDKRYLNWLQFWQQPWHEMMPGWQALLPGSLPGALQNMQNNDSWKHIDPAILHSLLHLDSGLPPEPGEVLLQWVALSPALKLSALYLAAEIVIRDIARDLIDDSHMAWARHLARALMPGKWPLAGYHDLNAGQIGILLLREWLSPSAWLRARLYYPDELSVAIENLSPGEIPGQRLNQLWHGVIWRLSTVEESQLMAAKE
ncbi:hypothetical protein [Vibrio quintilis]|uniref:Type III secretion protein n=1 Tax=Vibrio quintilis TaxID=1117707 RepID=A0A1M7YVY9_9VIBR|nr:hypothetical protein [Vibrio quintilis]SHO56774.1 hypothetical protein VQ7734_02543 [Vibrio quintilis]